MITTTTKTIIIIILEEFFFMADQTCYYLIRNGSRKSQFKYKNEQKRACQIFFFWV